MMSPEFSKVLINSINSNFLMVNTFWCSQEKNGIHGNLHKSEKKYLKVDCGIIAIVYDFFLSIIAVLCLTAHKNHIHCNHYILTIISTRTDIKTFPNKHEISCPNPINLRCNCLLLSTMQLSFCSFLSVCFVYLCVPCTFSLYLLLLLFWLVLFACLF